MRPFAVTKRWLLIAAYSLAVVGMVFGTSACGKLDTSEMVREIELYVTTADYDPIRYEFGNMAAENWRKLGFRVKVTPLAWPRLSQQGIQEHDFDAFTLNWAGLSSRIDPDHFVYLTLHSSQEAKGRYNIVGYKNPDYDKVAEASRASMDPEKRKEYVWEAQRIAAEDQPYIPIAHRNTLTAYNSRDFTNAKPMMGEGLNTFWNWINITPKTDRKTVVWGYPSDVTSLNPLVTVNAHDHQTLRLFYDRLVRVNPEGKPELWAAQSMKQIDPLTVDFTLRDGMTFHDGQPVTAEDVAYTFQLINDVKSPYFLGLVSFIESVTAKDKLTVEFKLKAPTASFVANTLGQVYILPKHVWSSIYAQGAQAVLNYKNEKPVGSGPFKMEYWRRDEEMKLAANKSHWVAPKVDGILKLPYANTLGMVAGLEAGECDVAGWDLEPAQADKLKSKSHLTIIEVPNHGFYHINLNMRRPPFDDKAVRLAMAYAVPKQQIVDQLLEGHGQVADSIIGPANAFWHNPNIKKISFSMDQARKILKDAGYRWDKQGYIYYPKGKVPKP